MKQWRKLLMTVMVVIAAVFGVAAFAACGNSNEVTVTFVTYDEQTIPVTGEKGAEVDFPEVTREGYVFDGWYADAAYSGTPVTSAVFEEDTTYYAKWAQGYAVTFELDGGTLPAGLSAMLYLKEGDVISTAVAAYIPTKTDLVFDGWLMDGKELSTTAKMPAEAVVLTAKYSAQYTVNVYLQDADLENYTLSQDLSTTGYAVVGEEFAPEISVEGYTLKDSEDNSAVISANKAENVFNLYFDRREFILTLNTNVPEGGTSDVEQIRSPYGLAVEIPAVETTVEGYRFFGWATSADATCDEVIDTQNYVLNGNVVLYGVWNKGYVDALGGSDVIYLNHDAENTAVLCRGGIDIPGTYDERTGWYEFASETTDYVLRVRLNESDGTFTNYADRAGIYYLFTGSSVDENVYIRLDSLNGITYVTSEEGALPLSGTYVIGSDGLYTATFSDNTTIVFQLGIVNNTTYVYVVRGAEYDFGVMPLLGQYYPALTLDGFGTATLITDAESDPLQCQYTMNGDDIFTLMENGEEIGSFRVFNYDGQYGYETYEASLDTTFVTEDESASLTLDGSSNAVFVSGTTKIEGKYTTAPSLYYGGYIVTVTSGDVSYRYCVYAEQPVPNVPYYNYVLVEKNTGYAEYVLCSQEGELDDNTVLIDNGDGTAMLVEGDKTITGTLAEVEYYYQFVVDAASNPDAGISSMLVDFDVITGATYGLNIYYVLLSTDSAEPPVETNNCTTYEGEDGRLIFVASYAIYIDAEGKVVSGVRADYTNYVSLAGDDGYYHFFTVDNDNKTFETLNSSPVVLTKLENGDADTSVTITVTGRELEEGKYEAIYSVVSEDSTSSLEGYYTTTNIKALGFGETGVDVCTFVSTDGTLTFKFLIMTLDTSYYFDYHAIDEEITIITYNAVDANGKEDENVTLSVTDTVTQNGQNVVVYNDNGTEVRGTYTSQDITVFNQFDETVYTFTATEGGTTFDFTMLTENFRICLEDAKYDAKEGTDTLELNGDTLIAKYTAFGGNEFYGIYAETDNVLNPDDKAIMLMIDTVYIIFDIDSQSGTYTVRGSEQATYIIYNNSIAQNAMITLNGYTAATITMYGDEEGEETTLQGTYEYTDGICKVSVEGQVVYTGRLGTATLSGLTVNAFFSLNEGFAGAYLNRDDLTVLVLDDIGNVTLYNTLGNGTYGTYTALDDGLFYYVNNAQTAGAVYTVVDGSYVVPGDYSATYYADDFASIIFYQNGVALYNNSLTNYFTRDEATGAITTYTYSDGADANEYGFVKGQLSVNGNTITYKDTEYNIERTYTLYNGQAVKFTSTTDTSTLEFTPSGAEFTVEATYVPADSEDGQALSGRYVVVRYAPDGTVEAFLAYSAQAPINGSSNEFLFTVTNELTLSNTARTFTLDPTEEYQLAMYDYMYINYLVSLGADVEDAFGFMQLSGTVQGDEIVWTLSGQINAVKDKDGNPLTFQNGVLSDAGYASQNYGHMFTCEFIGSDGVTYHMNFYIGYVSNVGIYCYLTYTLTSSTVLYQAENFTVSSEKLEYTIFEIPKGTDESGKTVYYAVGDEYAPYLKYNGEVLNIYAVNQSEKEWMFVSLVSVDGGYEEYDYVFTFEKSEDGAITSGSVFKLTTAYCKTADGDEVYFTYDVNTGVIDGVYAFVIDGEEVRVSSCVKNADGTFTATTEDATYKVTFTEVAQAADDNTTVTVNGKHYTVSYEVVPQQEAGEGEAA